MLGTSSMVLLPILFLAYSVSAMATAAKQTVLVTGAGGKTGRLVLQKLLALDMFDPLGVVRTQASKDALVQDAGIPADKLVIADVCDGSALEKACADQKIGAIIICTSATPAPTGEMTEEGRPKFGYPNGQPYQVDWQGQKNQIDVAKKLGTVQHVAICSSMGGTNPGNPLNMLGLDERDAKSGNILLWKRKAEKYLIDSGLASYTILHPGGLLDEAGGEREVVVGIDDQQLETENRSIPRADVAQLLVSSLQFPEAYRNRSFDARTKPVGEGTVTTDWNTLLQKLEGNCDYALGKIPDDDDDDTGSSSEL